MFRKENIVKKEGYIHSPPELIVEVLSLSNTRRDRAEKLHDYERMGVPEVWIVSPEARTVEILLFQDGRLRTSGIFWEGRLQPKHLPEASIDISSIWDE